MTKGNLFVYCEATENSVAEISLEILSKGRSLADTLGIKVEAVVLGNGLKGVEKLLFEYGADVVHIGSDKRLYPYLTLPHAHILSAVYEKEKPRIGLFGATSIGRDLAPRIASKLKCGLTADCTELSIGDYMDRKNKKEYKDILMQQRPAFGGNILATIVTPDTTPQLATVREGVMKKEKYPNAKKGTVKKIDVNSILTDSDMAVQIIERHIEENKIDLKNSSIVISGGYGVGSKENFDLLFEFADVLGAEVGGSRAAVDAGFIERDRQIGQTGMTVRPKLYIACGISGQIQHRAGMDKSAMIISINEDPDAPINQIADYVIIGDLKSVIPKMIKSYKENIK